MKHHDDFNLYYAYSLMVTPTTQHRGRVIQLNLIHFILVALMLHILCANWDTKLKNGTYIYYSTERSGLTIHSCTMIFQKRAPSASLWLRNEGEQRKLSILIPTPMTITYIHDQNIVRFYYTILNYILTLIQHITRIHHPNPNQSHNLAVCTPILMY